MNGPRPMKFAHQIRSMAKQNKPTILMIIGTIGAGVTTLLAIEATPKALKLIEEKKREEKIDQLTPFETICTVWKCYIPTMVTGTTSVLCLIGANSEHNRRHAALAAAASISETALRDYKEKTREIVGEKKEQQIRDAVAAEQIRRNPVKDNEVIITEKGTTLCYDALSGRYFEHDIDQLRRVEIYMNRQLNSEMYMSVNEYYDEIGLAHNDVGDYLGWNIDQGAIEMYFSSKLAKNDRPCLVVGFNHTPKYDFDKMF